MAILSKIRDRSLFLILIIGLALFAFVIDPQSIQSFFSTSKINAIGEVNGEEIDRESFMRDVEAYRSQSGGNVSQMQAVNAIWNDMVSEKVFQSQLSQAGIVVGEKDIWDAMVALPEIQQSSLFKNEANLFDEEKLKEYVAGLKDDAEAGNTEAWLNWVATEKNIKINLQRNAYTSLVTAGLGASLKEGERDYFDQNTKIDADFVFIPYTSIADSLGYVTREEIQKYLKDNSKRFKPEATRSLRYVKFDIVASASDEETIKQEVANYIEDREEYSNAAKTTVKVNGLKSAQNYEGFLLDNRSDLSLDNGYKYKSQLAASVADAIFEAEVGDVVGPYKDNGYFKISKVVETMELPDSVKSSHIIIPYAGATRSTSLKTKEQAKKTADSVFALVKNNKNKFVEIADEINSDGTKGKGGDIGWIRKDQAFSPSFDNDFANFIYKNKTGSIDVVETAFGYHIIKIDEQTKPQKAVKLASFGRIIEASDETENNIFEQAETLAANLASGQKLDDLKEEGGFEILSALNLKQLDEAVPGLGSQRQIVTWAFANSTKVNDSKRFDIEFSGKRTYVVAVVSGKTEKDGLVLSSDIIAQIRPELIDKKKAKLIKEKLNGATLEEMAQSSGTTVRKANAVTLASPLLVGVGNEPGVVAAMSTLPIDVVSQPIDGQKGVFIVKVSKKEKPIELDNYDAFRRKLAIQVQGRSYILYKVLEDAADINDNRAKFF